MDKGYLSEVKAILKSLVLSCPDKMTVDILNRDFREIEGEYIPFRRLGYKDIDQFLHSIPDTLRRLVSRELSRLEVLKFISLWMGHLLLDLNNMYTIGKIFGSGPTAMVCFVPNEKSDHIHDMIMEQRKPSRRRCRSKSKNKNQYNKSTSSRASNRFGNNSQPRRMPGQQLSTFNIPKRTHMTKTLSVFNAPSNVSSASKYQNHRPPCFSNQMQYTGYQLPQPIGINLMNLGNIQPAINIVPQIKIEKKPIIGNMNNIANISKEQEQVRQLTNLMTSSCHIRPPSKESQIKNLISPQLEMKTVTPSLNESQKQSQSTSPGFHTQPQPSRIVSFSTNTNTTNILNGIKPPKITNGVHTPKTKIKLSEDVQRFLTTMPSRCSLNPIHESSDLNVSDENLEKVVTKQAQNINAKPDNVIKKIFDISDEKVNDLDEAVPLFAANTNVLRLDFPDHTVRYGFKITPFVISDDLHIGAQLKIFISEIHNPFKFWFHIHKDDHELDLLMFQIERFYTNLETDELRIPILCLTPGQTCAACYNDLWHRAEIVAPPVNNKIKVLFVDYGTVSEIDVKNIKFLATCFANPPAQALRGCLSHIQPRFLHWSHEATTYFLSLVSELLIYAKITEIDRENRVLYMILCNTNGDQDIQINKALIQKQYAVLNENWQEDKIYMNNGKRLHHPREDFPTFSMIESGEYPSFTELISLQGRGIDYESIYDNIIFNKTSILNKHENAPEAIRKLPYFLMTTNPFRSDIIKELNGIMA